MSLRALIILLLLPLSLWAERIPQFEQHPGAQIPERLSLIDENGASVALRSLLGRPTLLVPGYYGCPMLCGQVQSGLLDSLKTLYPGDYQVICFSIDARERPALARQKRQAAHSRGADWRFLTGTPESISGLCSVVGFQFRYDRRSDQFAHPAGLVVLTPDGHVASYLFGISFSGPALQRALQGAAAGRIEGKVDPVNYLCFQYDPATGRYSLEIWRLVQLAGLGTSLCLLSLVGYWLYQERHP